MQTKSVCSHVPQVRQTIVPLRSPVFLSHRATIAHTHQLQRPGQAFQQHFSVAHRRKMQRHPVNLLAQQGHQISAREKCHVMHSQRAQYGRRRPRMRSQRQRKNPHRKRRLRDTVEQAFKMPPKVVRCLVHLILSVPRDKVVMVILLVMIGTHSFAGRLGMKPLHLAESRVHQEAAMNVMQGTFALDTLRVMIRARSFAGNHSMMPPQNARHRAVQQLTVSQVKPVSHSLLAVLRKQICPLNHFIVARRSRTLPCLVPIRVQVENILTVQMASFAIPIHHAQRGTLISVV